MNLEDQVASLELCKKLKELGVKQNSWLAWSGDDDAKVIVEYFFAKAPISAFTVAEMGEPLPIGIPLVRMGENMWFCQSYIHNEFSKTQADARAKMLIYLLENKLIDGAMQKGENDHFY